MSRHARLQKKMTTLQRAHRRATRDARALRRFARTGSPTRDAGYRLSWLPGSYLQDAFGNHRLKLKERNEA